MQNPKEDSCMFRAGDAARASQARNQLLEYQGYGMAPALDAAGGQAINGTPAPR